MRDPFLATAPTARQASRPWRNSSSMKRFADEPHLWHNTSSKIDECADSAAKGWVFSKRIGVFGDSIRLESILDLFFPWPGIHCLSRTAALSYYRASSSRLPRFLREPRPWLIRIRWQTNSIDHRITLISVFSVSNVSPRFPARSFLIRLRSQ